MQSSKTTYAHFVELVHLDLSMCKNVTDVVVAMMPNIPHLEDLSIRSLSLYEHIAIFSQYRHIPMLIGFRHKSTISLHYVEEFGSPRLSLHRNQWVRSFPSTHCICSER